MASQQKTEFDVIVVGGGNAALCGALAANENGARVVLLERAPEGERGGNSAFTGGTLRLVYEREDILRLMPDLTPTEIENSDFGRYTREEFLDAVYELTQYRTNPELAEILVDQSRDIAHWIKDKGVKLEPSYGRHAPNIG